MIIELTRTKRSKEEYQYAVTQKGQAIGTAGFPLSKEEQKKGFYRIEAKMTVLGQQIHLTIPRTETVFPRELSPADQAARFMSDQHMEGSINREMVKGKNVLGNYLMWHLLDRDKSYQMYEIGMGGKGLFFVIKQDESTLAIISKKLKTVNYLSSYTLYIEDEALAPLALVAALYWDVAHYMQSPYVPRSAPGSATRGTTGNSKRESHKRSTHQRELKAQYDPGFIPRIMALEGG